MSRTSSKPYWRPGALIQIFGKNLRLPDLARPPQPSERSATHGRPGELFQRVGGGGGAGGRFGDPDAELAGPADVVRGQYGSQIRDQRLLGRGGKTPGSAHFQPLDRSSVDRVHQ